MSAGIDDKARQELEEPVEALRQPRFLKADIEARHDRRGGGDQVVQDDQRFARGELGNQDISVTCSGRTGHPGATWPARGNPVKPSGI